MSNVNCLEGIRCPACGNEDRFLIEATLIMVVTDDGTMPVSGDICWDDDSYAECSDCRVPAKLGDFQTVAESRPRTNSTHFLIDALTEAMAEIEHHHGDMLTPEARNHLRGSGWARVYDKLSTALANARSQP